MFIFAKIIGYRCLATVGVLIYYSNDMFSQLKQDNVNIKERLIACGKNDSQCFRCSDIYQDMLKIVNKNERNASRKNSSNKKNNQTGVMSVFID